MYESRDRLHHEQNVYFQTHMMLLTAVRVLLQVGAVVLLGEFFDMMWSDLLCPSSFLSARDDLIYGMLCCKLVLLYLLEIASDLMLVEETARVIEEKRSGSFEESYPEEELITIERST